MIIDPFGGIKSKLHKLVKPILPAPCIILWFGNCGSNEGAIPASVPTVSTPTPNTSFSFANNSDAVSYTHLRAHET